jgi:predicted secreted protein with PEFG-CTERM motif
MNPGTSLHVTIDPIDREMQRIISNYNLNYSQPPQQSIPRNTTNIMASNLTRIQPSSSHLPILNATVNNLTSIQAVRNNHTVVTNMSKVIPTVPEFPFAMLVFVIAIFSIIFIQRRNTNKY